MCSGVVELVVKLGDLDKVLIFKNKTCFYALY